VLFSCREEDPVPRQNDEKSFAINNFDRLEISSAFDVTVQQGSAFSIRAQGDRRDLSDIELILRGTTLAIHYKNSGRRQYTTYLAITLPILYGADFSGAVNARITGFSDPVSRFDLSLSGASIVQLQLNSDELYVWLTGASNLRVIGSGTRIEASVSGASELTAFDYPVDQVKLTVSGASQAKVSAAQLLEVSASGASEVLYRGSPQIEQDVTGASSVKKD
jgi:hypothetical protein